MTDYNRIDNIVPYCVNTRDGTTKLDWLRTSPRFSNVSQNSERILMKILFEDFNSTMEFNYYGICTTSTSHNYSFLENITAIEHEVDWRGIKEDASPAIVIGADYNLELRLRTVSFGFLSCSKKRVPASTLDRLFHVFQLEVWIVTMFSLIIIGAIIHFTSNLANRSLMTVYINAYALLIEQNAPVATNYKKQAHLYFICGPWILMMLIITNSIRGDNVTNTVSPLSLAPFETFTQLMDAGFEFLDKLVSVKDRGMQHLSLGRFVARQKALFSANMDSNWLEWKKMESLVKQRMDLYEEELYTGILIQPFKTSTRYKNFTCNKLAYLGYLHELRQSQLHMEKKRGENNEYFLGKEVMVSHGTGWRLENVANPLINPRIRHLSESGIVARWLFFEKRAEEFKKYDRNSSVSKGPAALQMRGNLAELFIIFLIVFTTSIIVLLIEYALATLIVLSYDCMYYKFRYVVSFLFNAAYELYMALIRLFK
ncbi:hypothetical protein Fcan01_27751 [Folsomia candida]|uniref:Uncharacterized protein n=1 Tax=Folsomia candida TaxID=158441 RepID=A0A226CXF3_FOLCA|nr:hypothetical protein Fcan01_27751 [Folsomia candida]